MNAVGLEQRQKAFGGSGPAQSPFGGDSIRFKNGRGNRAPAPRSIVRRWILVVMVVSRVVRYSVLRWFVAAVNVFPVVMVAFPRASR